MLEGSVLWFPTLEAGGAWWCRSWRLRKIQCSIKLFTKVCVSIRIQSFARNWGSARSVTWIIHLLSLFFSIGLPLLAAWLIADNIYHLRGVFLVFTWNQCLTHVQRSFYFCVTAFCLGKTAENLSFVINFLSFPSDMLRSPVLQGKWPEQLFPYASSSNVEVLPLHRACVVLQWKSFRVLIHGFPFCFIIFFSSLQYGL